MRIGVLSDTHIPRRARTLPDAILQGLVGVDLILHAGDIQTADVLAVLAQLAPVQAVAGNVDLPELAEQLGFSRVIELPGCRLGLVHGHLEPAGAPHRARSTLERALWSFTDVQAVVFGHSHIALCEQHGGVLAFNPGSPTDKRRSPRPSYGILTLDDGGIRGEIVYF